ncbi:hypothetical protein QUD55_10895 [Lactococcus lactis]|uniref:hypothetical protein n=1 Tax=Lactococcus lactis TaxID=1358 RepID=UPI0025A06B2B|nr:hypothetical protein [Lactococcus lactis]MDM7537977.1 hypothetical protein [Lactococcus lactis]
MALVTYHFPLQASLLKKGAVAAAVAAVAVAVAVAAVAVAVAAVAVVGEVLPHKKNFKIVLIGESVTFS